MKIVSYIDPASGDQHVLYDDESQGELAISGRVGFYLMRQFIMSYSHIFEDLEKMDD